MHREHRNTDLRSWLDTATYGLCDVAKERVANEIREHYAEAVDTELAQGQCEDDAHRIALAALGDTKRAHRAFRRTYLTEKEASRLAGLTHTSKSTKTSRKQMTRSFLCATGAVFGLEALAGFPEGGRLTILMSGMVVSDLVSHWLCPNLIGERRWRRCVAWDLLSLLVLCAVSCQVAVPTLHALVIAAVPSGWMADFLSTVIPLIVLCALIVITAALARHSASLLRKLGKHTELYDSFLDGDDGGRYA